MGTTSRQLGRILFTGIIVIVTIGVAIGSWAYNQYSVNGDATNCRACHGDFRSSPYTSLSDGQNWGDDLHDIHRRTMLNSDCDTCHPSSGFFPVSMNSSAGGTGLPAIGCAGCHGRDEGSGVAGTGLRQHHWRADDLHPTLDLKVCGNAGCHVDADPANATPVGEDVKPPYYTTGPGDDPDHPLMPYDPCNPSPELNEHFAGLEIGLDNDGDLDYDENDGDCGAVAATPGEASGPTLVQMIVTAHDKVAGNVTISYGAACETSDNNIEFGDLIGISFPLGYDGQQCAIGNTGSAVFNYNVPAAPDSLFFLVVGNDGPGPGTVEGSYGTDSAGGERNDDDVNATCGGIDQDLTNRCD